MSKTMLRNVRTGEVFEVDLAPGEIFYIEGNPKHLRWMDENDDDRWFVLKPCKPRPRPLDEC